jgi:hypothetical protein
MSPVQDEDHRVDFAVPAIEVLMDFLLECINVIAPVRSSCYRVRRQRGPEAFQQVPLSLQIAHQIVFGFAAILFRADNNPLPHFSIIVELGIAILGLPVAKRTNLDGGAGSLGMKECTGTISAGRHKAAPHQHTTYAHTASTLLTWSTQIFGGGIVNATTCTGLISIFMPKFSPSKPLLMVSANSSHWR